MEDIRSQPDASVSLLYREILSSLGCQITFSKSHIRTKACLIQTWRSYVKNLLIVSSLPGREQLLVYISCTHVHFLQTSKGSFEKTKNKLVFAHTYTPPPLPPPLQQIIIQKSPSTQASTAQQCIESLHRRSLAGWLKSCSPEFPQWSKCMKSGGLAKKGLEVKTCYGLLFVAWKNVFVPSAPKD